MTKLLIRFFIKNHDDVKDPRVREEYGVLSGVVGIALNVVLSAVKFVIGILTSSIAVQADAVNNLSDVGSAVVTLIGFKAAGKPADREHPYGHARIEYVSALIIAFLILVVGFELGKESVTKILYPTPVHFDLVSIAVLALSILVKLWMSVFTSYIGKRISSSAIRASTADSICDVITTGSILISGIISYYKRINIDGYIGLFVAGFVLYSGVKIIRDAISPLMGEAPNPEMMQELKTRILSYEGILGLHDVTVHSYGPSRVMVSAHAEVGADARLMEIHETIDRAEREIGTAMGLLLTIHIDPVERDNTLQNEARLIVEGILKELDARLSMHDFRAARREGQILLTFDLVVPPELKSLEVKLIKARIKERLKEANRAYACSITLDTDYHGRV
ncbi:MAG: cation diffusion facilitator family transporter [Clostridiaceae bacterium]|nr:cation diffusion facilitator family transporter [Eubacteriales bacterium]